MKNSVYLIAITIILSINIATCTISDQDNTYDYIDHGKDWIGKCKTGKLQSPVDLGSNFEVPTTQIAYFYHRYLTRSFWNVTWMNTTVILSSTSDNDKVIGGLLYTMPPGRQPLILRATQIRFRSPSEHTINGKQFDLEMQIINYPYYTQAGNDKVAVSIMFTVGQSQDPNLQNITTAQNNSQVYIDLTYYNLNNETDMTQSYYYYWGSFTYPTCGALGWQVFEKPFSATQSQINFFLNQFNNETNKNFNGTKGNNRQVFDFTDPQASTVKVYYHKSFSEQYQ